MDPRIALLLDRFADDDARAEDLAALSDEQLSDIEAELVEAFRALRGEDDSEVSAEALADMERIHAATEHIAAERVTRVEAAAVAATEATERAERAAALAEALETETVPDETVSDEGGDPEPEPEPEPEVVPEATASAAPTLATMARRMPASAQVQTPRIVDSRPRWELANGNARTTSMQEVSERMAEAANSFISAPPGFADRVKVASLHVDYPEERNIGRNDDAVTATSKVRALTANARRQPRWTDEESEMQAIVAAGGFCAPSEPRYDIFSVVSADRPFRGGLPNIGVGRGALTYVRGGRLSGIDVSGAGAAVTVWPESTDITPGGSTKTAQVFACRTPQEKTLQAIVAQVQFGNFTNRAFPELVQDDITEVMAAHARVAEKAGLDSLITEINTDVAQTGFFGTARDVKQVLMQMQAQLRYVERSNTPMRSMIERTILPMIAQDVLFQAASGDTEALFFTEDDARRLVASSGVNVSYLMDSPSGPEVIVGNSDGENLADYPDTFEFPFFYEGSVAFLDGGTLDLGIVRDSTLNATNDYQIFMETFEEVAWFGPHALTLTLTTCPNGFSQVPSSVTTVCSGS